MGADWATEGATKAGAGCIEGAQYMSIPDFERIAREWLGQAVGRTSSYSVRALATTLQEAFEEGRRVGRGDVANDPPEGPCAVCGAPITDRNYVDFFYRLDGQPRRARCHEHCAPLAKR